MRMREVVGEIRGERRVRQLCEKKGRGFRGEEMREKEERRNLTHLNIKQVSSLVERRRRVETKREES